MCACPNIIARGLIEVELASAVENASLLGQNFASVHDYLICAVALFMRTNAYFTTRLLEEIEAAERVGVACRTWEALAGDHHLFVGPINFDMRASSGCFVWSLVKIVLAKRSRVTLGFVI
tara:strand:+ start:214 stop:573 length:360 start_codon:yes stop_codon:yes gene_type:complete